MIKQLMAMVVVLGITASSQAGIATQYTVDDGAHILDGAVFNTYVDGADTWAESVITSGDFGAVGSNLTLNISGASGSGAAWNGNYTYYDGLGGFPLVGAAYEGSTGSSYGAVGLNAAEGGESYWQDGFGNQLTFTLVMGIGVTAASDGDGVEQDNFGNFNTVVMQKIGGGNAGFSSPAGGSGSVTVIPEPSTIALGGIVGLCLLGIRRAFMI